MATDKNLPIKFFQKRQKDEMDTEGGGSGAIPKWVDSSLVVQKSVHIREVLNTVAKSLSKKVKQHSYIPSVVKLKVNEDALAKTYRREIGNLFNFGKLNIIGVSGEDEVLIKIDNEDDLNKIVRNFEKIESTPYPSNATVIGISAISNIEEFKPIVNTESGTKAVLKIKLFNYGNSDLNRILTRAFEKYCQEKKIEIKNTVYSADLNIYSAVGVTADTLEDLKDFEGIQNVSEMPSFDLTLDGF